MILFNCKKGGSSTSKSRHSLGLEPPLLLYLGINVHTQTRSRKLVTQLCQFGLSVSYDRILQVENHLATGVCQDIAEIGIVCPSQLRHELFTIGALDNLDHNPSSTTAKIPSMAQVLDCFSSRAVQVITRIKMLSSYLPAVHQKISSYLLITLQYQQLCSLRLVSLSTRLLIALFRYLGI